MEIAPSILSANFANIKEQLIIVEKYCKYLHFDVMDGVFVPNISFGPKILNDIDKFSDLIMDVHLMIVEPHKYFEVFKNSGADIITFHYEAYDSNEEIIKHLKAIRSLGIKSGISIKPKTEVDVLLPLMEHIDNVLVMTVEPGFGGQSMIDSCVAKIDQLNKMKENHTFTVTVDGGVNDKTISKVKEADIVVSGSFVFKGSIPDNLNKLK